MVGQVAAEAVELVVPDEELRTTEEVELVLVEEELRGAVEELVVVEEELLGAVEVELEELEEEARSPILEEVELIVVEELRAKLEENCTPGLLPRATPVSKEFIVVVTTSPVMEVICSCSGSCIWPGTPLVETKKLSG